MTDNNNNVTDSDSSDSTDSDNNKVIQCTKGTFGTFGSDTDTDNDAGAGDHDHEASAIYNTPPKKKTKYFNSYRKVWEQSFSWLTNTSNEFSARCKICSKVFSIKGQGLAQVKQHEQTKQHQSQLVAVRNNTLISTFCKKSSNREENWVSAIELALVYHNIKHNLSYNSLDCGAKLLKHLLHTDSSSTSITDKIHLGRTKAQALAVNVLAPNNVEVVLKQLANNYFTVQTDSSNVKNRKFFPVVIHYFNLNPELGKFGVTSRLLDFIESADESAIGMFHLIEQCLIRNNLSLNSVCAFSGDNCNANFGVNNSLFTNLREHNRNIIKANCHAHIAHNAAKNAIDKLDYDVENLVLKVYAHFSLSAKRRETLKSFFEFNDSEYHEVLRHVTTRWLSLLPCIERILKSWQSLVSYFKSLRDCPNQIKKLLYINDEEYEYTPDNEIPEIYLLFCVNFLKIFNDAILHLESNSTSVLDLHDIFHSMINKLSERRDQQFFGFIVSQKLKNIDVSKANKIRENFLKVLNFSITYLKKWFDFGETSWLSSICKLNLKNPLLYSDVVEVTSNLPQLKVDVDAMFDEVTIVNKILELTKQDQVFIKSKGGEKWTTILEKTKEIPNISMLMAFLLGIPATSAFVERIFSIMTNKWSDARNRASTELIRAELLTTINNDQSCKNFFDFIRTDDQLLRKVQTSAKYV